MAIVSVHAQLFDKVEQAITTMRSQLMSSQNSCFTHLDHRLKSLKNFDSLADLEKVYICLFLIILLFRLLFTPLVIHNNPLSFFLFPEIVIFHF